MPTFELEISAVSALTDFAKIKDVTADYPNRALVGNYILIWKMDVNGQIVADVSPVQANDFLTILEWQFDTAQDGHYKFTLLSVPIWDIAEACTKETVAGANDATIRYYDTTKTFYKCILNDTGTAPDDPGGSLIWEEISDFSEIIDNTSIDTHEHNDLITSKHEQVFNEKVDKVVQQVAFCDDCSSFKEIEIYTKVAVLLDGAQSLNYVDRSSDMERVERFVENTYINL